MTINSVYLKLYPMVVQIAAEYPDHQDAKPHLRELAWDHQTPMLRLIGYYMELRPDQTRECPRCHETVHVRDFASTKCLDCVQVEYEEAQE